MTTITPALLAEIKAKAEKATQGRWERQSVDLDGPERGSACVVGAELQGLIIFFLITWKLS